MRIDQNRKKKLLYNNGMSLLNQLVTVICGIILPSIWLKYYGSEVYGLVASINQFLGAIAFLEFGIGAVVQYSLYKPLAEKNDDEISRVVISSEKFFKKIAYIFLIYIIFLIIFYPLFSDSANSFDRLYTASMIIILSISSFAQYYFGITYQLLLSADQKSYIQLIIQCGTLIINTIICIILAISGISIHIVKLVTSLIFLVRPILLQWYVKNNYNINKKIALTYEPIKQKWNGVAQHLAYTIVHNTDIVVLTVFSNLKNVSIYSVYFNIVSGIRQVICALTAGMQSLIGNMLANDEMQLLDATFEKYEWQIHTMVSFLFACTSILIIPFVQIYTNGINDTNYIVPGFAFFLTMSQAAYCMRLPYNVVVNAAGHYKQTQISAIVEMLLNLGISVFTVVRFGLIGVAIGTFVALIYRSTYLAWYLSKNILCRPIGKYIKHIVIDILILLCSITCSKCFQLSEVTFCSWVILAVKVGISCLGISLIINYIFYRDNLINFVGELLPRAGTCQCAQLRALHIAECKRPPDKL